jgi:pyrroloquinoline-quinone synthase
MPLSERLVDVIREHDLLQHPFYEAWTAGELDLDSLRMYAAQYYRQVEAFPRFVSSVHSRCPDLSSRKVLLENLLDEELHGTDHPTLWLQFAEGLGVDAATVAASAPLPETRRAVDVLYSLTGSDWTRGLCALYAYEQQVPEISATKVEGLKKHYGIEDPRTLAFFTAHQQYDVEHARAVGRIIDRHVDPDAAEEATRRAGRALWTFLDGVAREADIHC